MLPLAGIGTKRTVWRFLGVLVVLAALLIAYQGGWYLWARSHFQADPEESR